MSERELVQDTMDRPEPGLIKWSQNPGLDRFLHINLQHRIMHVYQSTGHAQRGRFDWSKLSQHDDFPPLTTYDWSPSIPGLVAVGTSSGIVNLLRVDDNSNAYHELHLKVLRSCQAVAFNTTGRLAVGLDRVRSDSCLHIWDVCRLAPTDALHLGFPRDMEPFGAESGARLEPSVAVSSVKFFEDNPHVLIAGIKGQGLRIHDLRDHGHHSSVQFTGKACNNLAIDYADTNYFASSTLDGPDILVWDRRTTQRQLASPTYLEAVDRDHVPWGAALRLGRSMQAEEDKAMHADRNSFIRSLRFSRDRPGMLGALSRTGQLKVLSTQREQPVEVVSPPAPAAHHDGGPELLEVRRSTEMEPRFLEPSRKSDRIVSFDWVTLHSAVLRPRMVVLRANGAFEIMEKPSFTSEYPFKLIPWQAPHRGLNEGDDYHSVMHLEPSQAACILGPLRLEEKLADLPLFGSEKAHVHACVDAALESSLQPEQVVRSAEEEALPKGIDVAQAHTTAEKIVLLRQQSEEAQAEDHKESQKQRGDEPLSQREMHEILLSKIKRTGSMSRKAEEVIDHVMLLRAKEKYLFNFSTNQQVVADDPWLQGVWAWVAGAEDAAADGGMMSYPLDLSFMGVYTVWTNNLGSRPHTRLSDGAATPDEYGWARSLGAICKKLSIPKYDGVETRRPHHRELCLDMCTWGPSHEAEDTQSVSVSVASLKREPTWHTRAAAHALFRGNPNAAVQILKKASSDHPSLLFVSLALQLVGKDDGGDGSPKQVLEFDARVASKTDPYLRAISSIIGTRDWTTVVHQTSLPLRDRAFVALRHLSDDAITTWLESEIATATSTGDIEGIVLTGITDPLVDILACYVQKFNDYQTATLLLSVCAPRFIDDIRATAFRTAYRAYLQRHHAFYLRAKFEVESTKRSKHNGRPTVLPPARQIALRCVHCDAETSLGQSPHTNTASSSSHGHNPRGSVASVGLPNVSVVTTTNPYTDKMVTAGISCPNCKRQLPRCVVCLEVVGAPRSDRPELAADPEIRRAARFPTFCLRCEHVLHLDHARQWFARHQECPVPECRCKCNFRANPELSYT